ncbi:MAG: hypothetical protein ACI4RT_08440, partial [Candidatus Spyradenecus sp.]
PCGRVFYRLTPGASIETYRAFVDIFIVDPVPSGRLAQLCTRFMLVALRRLITRKQHQKPLYHPYALSSILLYLAALPFSGFSHQTLVRLHDLLSSFPRRARWVRCDRDVFPSDWFVTSSTLTFGGHELPVPSETEAMLQQLYGDWQTPPPEDNRVGHAYVTHSNGSESDHVLRPADNLRKCVN